MAAEADTQSASELVDRARAGEVAAFERLVEQHRDRVYGLAVRMTRSPADAAEIAQETFLSAYQHLGEFRGDAAFGSWVHRIAANLALMKLRHRKVREVAEAELSALPQFNERGSHVEYPQSDWSRRADERALDAELLEAIRNATDRLPADYREAFLLKDVEGLSYEELAEITGESIAAIKSRLHRARLALRDAIDRYYNES